MNQETRYQVRPEVLSRVLAGEAVLLDLQSGTYFGLNDVATRVWELLREPRSPAELAEQLTHEFEVTLEMARGDVDQLVGELIRRGLVGPA